MKVEALPSGTAASRFVRVPDAVETFRLVTERYEIEAAWATSAFYGPDFFRVQVRDRAGRTVWSGGDALFLDSLFRVTCVSDRFHRLVLTRVHDTSRGDRLQVILVDLDAGMETTLTEVGGYDAGLFDAFDGVHVHGPEGVACLDLASGERFPITERLAAVPGTVRTWAPTPVPRCILVVTDSTEDNLVLLELASGEVRERATLRWRPGDRATVTIDPPPGVDAVDLSVVHARPSERGAFVHAGTERFRVTF